MNDIVALQARARIIQKLDANFYEGEKWALTHYLVLFLGVTIGLSFGFVIAYYLATAHFQPIIDDQGNEIIRMKMATPTPTPSAHKKSFPLTPEYL